MTLAWIAAVLEVSWLFPKIFVAGTEVAFSRIRAFGQQHMILESSYLQHANDLFGLMNRIQVLASRQHRNHANSVHVIGHRIAVGAAYLWRHDGSLRHILQLVLHDQ